MLMPGGFRQSETAGLQILLNYHRKLAFATISHPPISWGTASILPLPVVEFKKNFQKSYKGVIPK